MNIRYYAECIDVSTDCEERSFNDPWLCDDIDFRVNECCNTCKNYGLF